MNKTFLIELKEKLESKNADGLKPTRIKINGKNFDMVNTIFKLKKSTGVFKDWKLNKSYGISYDEDVIKNLIKELR